jgi:hypothetical protein
VVTEHLVVFRDDRQDQICALPRQIAVDLTGLQGLQQFIDLSVKVIDAIGIAAVPLPVILFHPLQE